MAHGDILRSFEMQAVGRDKGAILAEAVRRGVLVLAAEAATGPIP